MKTSRLLAIVGCLVSACSAPPGSDAAIADGSTDVRDSGATPPDSSSLLDAMSDSSSADTSPSPDASAPACGNGSCESGESCGTCGRDCPCVESGPIVAVSGTTYS